MRPFVLAVAGGTASGKSTLADALKVSLGGLALSITHDLYYKTAPPKTGDGRLYNYDHPDALDSALLATHLWELKKGRPVKLPRYDYVTSVHVPDVTHAEPKPLVLVDGILILAEEKLRPLFDFIVFVEAPDDVRFARRVRRDTTDRGQTLDYVLDQYLDTVKPMHDQYVAPSAKHAHLVLDGTKPVDGLVRVVLDRVVTPCENCGGSGSVCDGPGDRLLVDCPRCDGHGKEFRVRP
jgi:uridine kinase